MYVRKLATILFSAAILLCATSCWPTPEATAIPTVPAIVAPATALPSIQTPEQVVNEFYEWYIGYASGAEGKSPLVDGVYKTTGKLTDGFIRQIEDVVASFDRGATDPILCAQDVPTRVTVRQVALEGEQANVLVETSFENHSLWVELVQVDGQWKINDIRPNRANLEPDQVVQAFYEWYLGYVGRGEQMRNPLVDKAYRSSVWLTEAFIARVDEIIAGFGTGGYDPFLQAQDIPSSVHVEGVHIEGDKAMVTVSTSFEGHHLEVELVRHDSHWQINDIRSGGPTSSQLGAANPQQLPTDERDEKHFADQIEGWQVYHNTEYGFRISYPNDWVFTEAENDPNQSPIGPECVRLQVMLMPRAWADQLAIGNNDPNTPVIAPFCLEVSLGSMEEYRQAYMEPTQSASLDLNGTMIVREEEQIADTLRIIRYVAVDPSNDQQRITLLDMTSGFPDRLKGNEAVIETFQKMVGTLQFVS